MYAFRTVSWLLVETELTSADRQGGAWLLESRDKATGQGRNKKGKKTEWNHTVNEEEGVGEMAQRLGKQTSLTEGISLSPGTYTGKPSTTWGWGSKGSDALFWPPWAPALICTEPLPDAYSNTYRKTKQSLKRRGRLAKGLDAEVKESRKEKKIG